MRTELIKKTINTYRYGWDDEIAEYDEYEYVCPCGKGKIVECHDETPGNREHLVWILCEECSKKYKLDKSRGARNWELMKIELDKWDTFLERLEDGNEFDKQLKEYLSAIKYVSEIKEEKIDDDIVRNEINEKIRLIVKFIEQYGEDYYEIGLIKGFKINKKSNFEQWEIDGRDYYYYIADQKIKASVYYVRYLNFINRYFSGNENAEKYLETRILQIQSGLDNLKKSIKVTKDNVIGIIDDEMEETDENKKLREECIECINQIKTKDINYLKYMLFNNMMREMRYLGAAYQYLWHWEIKNKNLFRYVSYEGKTLSIESGCTKKKFLQKMFSDVICHMNNSGGELCSYSEDPYVDIFKYLKIWKCNNDEYIDINSSDLDIKIEIKDLKNDNKANFEIIKGININTIFRDGKSKSFYEFVQDGISLSNEENLAYAVELYPSLSEQGKNSKETTKNIKNLLTLYLETWADEGNLEGLRSYVADDKEVVTYGKIEKKEVEINGNIPTQFLDGYKYKMSFGKNELIYLLLKIRNTDIDEIVKRIKVELNMQGKEFWFGQALKHENVETCTFTGHIFMWITDKKEIRIPIKSTVKPSITECDKKEFTIEGCKRKIKENVEVQIQEFFKHRYESILDEKHDIADCVLNFINSGKHKCPTYISEYNEYDPGKGDEEISILKYLIFKR